MFLPENQHTQRKLCWCWAFSWFKNWCNVFPHIVSAETILFWLLPYVLWPLITVHKCAETIQGRKLFKGGNYMRKYGTQCYHVTVWCESDKILHYKRYVSLLDINETTRKSWWLVSLTNWLLGHNLLIPLYVFEIVEPSNKSGPFCSIRAFRIY